jgi:GT2 family glycosyltransferase
MERLTLSVIICVYADDRWGQIVAAIDSVRQQQHAPEEIVVVVDHNPALLARLHAEIPDIIVVENHEERGLSGARNSGVQASSSDVVAFLDDDAVAAADWLTWLRIGFANPDVAGVGGQILPAWSDARPGWFPEEFDWVVGCTYRGMPETTGPVRNVIGANMAFRRDLFNIVGGFRSGIGRVGTLPVGCEETEICIRVRQQIAGSTFIYEPRAQISHHVPADRSTWRYFRQRCFAEGRSKALVSQFVGRSDGLSTEWKYTIGALPAAVGRASVGTITRGDWWGVPRAAAVAAGLGMTTAGFLAGSVASRRGVRRQSDRLSPARLGVLMSPDGVAATSTPEPELSVVPSVRRSGGRDRR